MPDVAANLVHFLREFPKANSLPLNVTVENPYQKESKILGYLEEFAKKYYADNNERVGIFGINPGRFGGLLTGISFTDPSALVNNCKIAYQGEVGRAELSSQFIYQVIGDSEMGGPEEFYRRFYIGSLYPFTLLTTGKHNKPKNYNYYDSPSLFAALKEQIIYSIRQQIAKLNLNKEVVVCLGKKNAAYLRKLNEKEHFFETIVDLPHPRYLMQYRSPGGDCSAGVTQYLNVLKSCKEGVYPRLNR